MMKLSKISKRAVRAYASGFALTFGWLAAPIHAQEPDVAACTAGEIATNVIKACAALIASTQFDEQARAKFHTIRGNAWMKEQEADAAVADFSQAIKLAPKSVLALEGRARAQTIEGHHDLAAADWSKLIEIHPERYDFYLHRGNSQLALKKSGEALADFDKTISLDPKNVAAYVGRAKAFDQNNDRDKALAEFALALKTDPGYIPAYIAKAEAAERWGDVPMAVDSLAAALRLNGINLHIRQELQRLGVYTPSN